jgi:hypothetical protein
LGNDPKYAIYPNPAKEYVCIDFIAGINESTLVKILDISGKIVFSQILVSGNADVHSIDISSFKEGIYIIKIDNSQFSATHKLIKITH